MAYVIFNLLCVAVLIGIDQGIKFWAVHVLMPVGTLPLIPHVVELRFVLNQGMAFRPAQRKAAVFERGHQCCADPRRILAAVPQPE